MDRTALCQNSTESRELSNFNLCSASNPNYIDAISKNSLPFVMHGRDLFYMP